MTYLLICLMQLISIHVPTRGTTALLKQNGFKIKFQSTFPRGERHYDGLDIITANIFQSTFPRGERPWRYTVRRSTKRFQSTFPRGERPICPPEGDAGTGMTATNSVAVRTGNVSAGTSVFAMVVLEEELKKLHEEIDLVTTPSGEPVAMVHCNNCTSDINAWVNIFREFAQCMGMEVDTNALYTNLFQAALAGDPDCGGLMGYNYFSGEPVTGFEEGRPLVIRTPETKFNLANFMRMHLYTSLGALKVGLDILLKEEQVQIDKMFGHGGFFKTPLVGQKIMSAAMNAPVSVMETAGEGGAWGIAVLAAFMMKKEKGETLDAFLNDKVFAGQEGITVMADQSDVEGFDAFMVHYKNALPVEKAAVEALR